MRPFILLVTWIVFGQPPSSYQVTFNSAEACESARAAVLVEGQRLKEEFLQRATTATRGGKQTPLFAIAAPAVTAVCAAQ